MSLLVFKSLIVLRDAVPLFAPLEYSVQPGCAYQLIGPNGQGKTTLLRTIAGLYQQYSGTLHWRDELMPLYLGHNAGVHHHLTLLENVEQLFLLYGLSHLYIDDILLLLGLMGYEDVITARLSAGQKRKIALTPLFHPDVRTQPWLLDEPFTALDQHTCGLVEQLMLEYCKSCGLVIFTSHQPLLSKTLQQHVKIIALEPSDDQASRADL